MKRIVLGAMMLGLLGAGCGDDTTNTDPDATVDLPHYGFETPTEVAKGWEDVNGVLTDRGVADFSCAGTNKTLPLHTFATNETSFSILGMVVDFSDQKTPIASADISIFDGIDMANPLFTGTTNGGGTFSTGAITTEANFLGTKTSGTDRVNTIFLNQVASIAVDAPRTYQLGTISVAKATSDAMVLLARPDGWTAGRGVFAGTIVDCRGFNVSNVIATVSTTADTATHNSGAESYYFRGGTPKPNTDQKATDQSGTFMVLENQPASLAYVQVWGFEDGQDPTTDAMTLLGQIPVPLEADTVTISGVGPRVNWVAP